MARNSIPQASTDQASDDDGFGPFDAYRAESYARGWDAQAAKMGNPQARRAPPVPGAYQDYDSGETWAAALAAIIFGV